jgi:hypothetical protein
MSPELNDREWQVFMSNAFGLSVSEEGLLIDTDGQRDLATWSPAERPGSTSADC